MIKVSHFIGIDAGASGSIAYISAGRPPVTVSMPGSVDDLKGYFDYIKGIAECPIACVEKVGLWKSDQRDGRAFGIEKMTRSLNEITTILRIVKIPFIQIYPVQWQAYLNVRSTTKEEYSDRKRRFKEIAQKNFPQVKVTLTNADALLIMQFLGLKWQREPLWIINKLPQSIVKELDL
jgi:hypothetical protein